jgi:hypothetical protein
MKSYLMTKMKDHDWFYERSDDHSRFLKGTAERQEIYDLLHSLPACDIPPLVEKFVPKEEQEKFVLMLCTYNKNLNKFRGDE